MCELHSLKIHGIKKEFQRARSKGKSQCAVYSFLTLEYEMSNIWWQTNSLKVFQALKIGVLLLGVSYNTVYEENYLSGRGLCSHGAFLVSNSYLLNCYVGLNKLAH